MFSTIRNLVGGSNAAPVQQSSQNQQAQAELLNGLRLNLQHAMERPDANPHEIATLLLEIDTLVTSLKTEYPLIAAVIDLTNTAQLATPVETQPSAPISARDWTDAVVDRINKNSRPPVRQHGVPFCLHNRGAYLNAPDGCDNYRDLVTHLANIGECDPCNILLVYGGDPVSVDGPILPEDGDCVQIIIRAPNNLR
ncbi:MAG: hypothetical protein Q8K75_03865 [Chlamydiales bacterium]|nr:hypothetical protein [Chlamydiales bacterium]